MAFWLGVWTVEVAGSRNQRHHPALSKSQTATLRMLRTSAGERLWGAAELKGEGGHGPYCCNQNIMNQIWTSASCTFKTTDKRRKKNYLVLIWLPSLPRPANLTCTRKSARSCAVQGRQLACELPPRAPNSPAPKVRKPESLSIHFGIRVLQFNSPDQGCHRLATDSLDSSVGKRHTWQSWVKRPQKCCI